MNIVNLTPHPLLFSRECPRCQGTALRDSGEPLLGPCGECEDGLILDTIPSSGVARCEAVEEEVGSFAGLPIVITRFGKVVGLPEPGTTCETVYVVSAITAQACAARRDVFIPARPIRDAQGRIVACRALGRIA